MTEATSVKLKIVGVSPLLMNQFVMRSGKASGPRVGKAQNEKESGLWRDKVYWSEEQKCVALPSYMIEACFAQAAKMFKSGKRTLGAQAKATVFIAEDEIPIICKGKRITELEENGQIQLDGRRAVVQRNAVERFRPMLREWSMEFTVHLLEPEVIDEKQLRAIAERAGRFNGLGDFRPRFGRFSVQ